MKIDYQIPCKCGHKGENHKASLLKTKELIRAECLLCSCHRYRPDNSSKSTR